MRLFLKLFGSLIIIASLAVSAEAANKTWAGTTGDWGTAGNWSPSGVPVAADNVYIPPSSTQAITAGLNQSGVALGIVYFQPGYTKAVATSAAYLQLNCSTFIFASTGQAYIELGSSAITAVVQNTAAGTTTVPGLFLKGSALTALACSGGNTALAGLPGETSTVTTARCAIAGTQLAIGSGVTLTTANCSQGTMTINCAATTCNVNGGTFYTAGTGAITTINVNAGTCFPNSSGTITNLNLLGGITDTTKYGVPRTISNFKGDTGASFSYDPNIITITTHVAPDEPVRIVFGNP